MLRLLLLSAVVLVPVVAVFGIPGVDGIGAPSASLLQILSGRCSSASDATRGCAAAGEADIDVPADVQYLLDNTTPRDGGSVDRHHRGESFANERGDLPKIIRGTGHAAHATAPGWVSATRDVRSRSVQPPPMRPHVAQPPRVPASKDGNDLISALRSLDDSLGHPAGLFPQKPHPGGLVGALRDLEGQVERTGVLDQIPRSTGEESGGLIGSLRNLEREVDGRVMPALETIERDPMIQRQVERAGRE